MSNVTLAGITISDSCHIAPNVNFIPKVSANVARAINGNLLIQEKYIPAGYAIDIVYPDDSQGLTNTQIEQIQAIADNPNTSFVLKHFNKLYTVRFRHEEAPALELNSTEEISNIEDCANANYVGRIKLMVI